MAQILQICFHFSDIMELHQLKKKSWLYSQFIIVLNSKHCDIILNALRSKSNELPHDNDDKLTCSLYSVSCNGSEISQAYSPMHFYLLGP